MSRRLRRAMGAFVLALVPCVPAAHAADSAGSSSFADTQYRYALRSLDAPGRSFFDSLTSEF